MRRTVSVWLLTTSQPVAVLDQLAGVLDQPELARAAVMTEPEVHTEFVVSHAAARLILAELLGVPPASLHWRHGRSGKPQLVEPVTDLQMSLSHSDGLAALAVCTGYPVGIDVQRRRSAAGLIRMAERYFPPAEAGFVAEAAGCPDELGRRFSMLWTRKEACAKVGGGRLIPALAWPSDHPDDPDSIDPLGPFRSGDPVAGASVLIRDLVMPDGFHGAVATAGRSDFEVIMHWWEPEAVRYGRPAAIRTESSFDQIGVPMAVPGC